MPIALGLTSRPTYDAAEPLLRNKQIEQQRELELKRLALQKKLAQQQQMMQALGMLNQNMQQQRSQENQRAMQQEQIQAQMARDAQQQAAQGQSLLERQFNQMQANWRNQIAAAEKAGFQINEKHQPKMAQLEQAMLDIDQRIAAGTENVADGTRAKMAILRQMAVFKPDAQIRDPMDAAAARILRVGPDGQRLKPGDPPVPGERQFTIDDKGVPHAVTPPPAPKPDPAIAAQQKMVESINKAETALTSELRKATADAMKETVGEDKVPKFKSWAEAENEARNRMAPERSNFERQFGVTPKALTPPPSPQMTPQQRSDLGRARQLIQSYGHMPAGSNGPQHDQVMNWANRTVEQLAPLEQASGSAPQPQSAMPPANINGRPLNDFGQYVLSEAGQSVNEGNFSQSPIGERYIQAAGGDQQQAYQQFESDRSAVESLVPKISGDPPSNAQPGAKFFNDRGELLTNLPNATPIPKRRGSRPPGGGGGGSRPPQGRGGGSGAPKPGPDSKGAPKQAQPPRGMPLDRILGSGDGKDRRGNVPPKTMLILKKGDPANKKLFDEVIAKMDPAVANGLVLVEVDPSQPESATNRLDLVRDQSVDLKSPTLIRTEWDGKKYVPAETLISPVSSEEVTAFMRNGKDAPAPNGQATHSYVILDAADKSGAAEKWAKVSGQMSDAERSNVTVFKIDSRLPDSPTNDMGRLVALGIDPKSDLPAIVRGEWRPGVDGKPGGYKVAEEWRGAEKVLPHLASKDAYKGALRSLQQQQDDANRAAEPDSRRESLDSFTKSANRFNGDPIKGARDPYQPADANADHRQLRVQSLHKQAYEDWRNAVESGWNPGGGREMPANPKAPLAGPSQEEINAAKESNQIGPKSPMSPAPTSDGKGQVVKPTARSAWPADISPKTGLTPREEESLRVNKLLMNSANQTIERLNAIKAGTGVIGKGGKLSEEQRKDYDAAKAQRKFSEEKIRELETKGRETLQDLANKGITPADKPTETQPAQRGNVPAALPRGVPTSPAINAAPTGAVPQARDGASALQVIREIGRLSQSPAPEDRAQADVLHQQVQRWADNTINKGQTKIGGYDLIGDEPASKEDRDIAKDIKQSSGLPQGTGVLQGLKQINDGKMNPVSVDAARGRLQQRIDQMLKQQQSQMQQQQKAQQSQQQDRARQEQPKITNPIQMPSAPLRLPGDKGYVPPIQMPSGPPGARQPMSSLPPLQPSRSQQLRQGLATSVMRPGQLNLDQINAGLTAMGGNNPQPYTGGILGGMQKPRTAPSNELGMMFPQAQQLQNPYAPPGGFIGQGGYQGQQDIGGYSPYGQPYDYGYNTPYPYFDGGGYVAPIIELPQSSYGMSDQYDSSNGQYFGNQFESWAGGSDYNTYQGSYPAGDFPEISYGGYS